MSSGFSDALHEPAISKIDCCRVCKCDVMDACSEAITWIGYRSSRKKGSRYKDKRFWHCNRRKDRSFPTTAEGSEFIEGGRFNSTSGYLPCTCSVTVRLVDMHKILSGVFESGSALLAAATVEETMSSSPTRYWLGGKKKFALSENSF